MRRFVVMLMVLNLAAFSQPAQQKAGLPPVVKLEMPPTNLWMHLAESLWPGIVGAGSALLGVWLTNKNNQKTNAANRQHASDIERTKDEIAAEAKIRDNRWAFRKDVYVNLVYSITDCILVLAQFHDLQLLVKFENPDADIQKRLEDHRARFMAASATFVRNANLAPLAIADSVLPVLMTLDKQLPAFFASQPERATSLKIIANFNAALSALQLAGREDLWGTPETDEEAETHLQAASPAHGNNP